MMRGYICNLVLLTVIGTGHAIADTLPFEGKWARTKNACGSGVTGDGGAPITLSARRLVAQPLMICEFKSVLPGGISYRVEASCDANGQQGEEFFTFAVLAERLYWSWGGRTATFERCPR
jgi:hypothetical protein